MHARCRRKAACTCWHVTHKGKQGACINDTPASASVPASLDDMHPHASKRACEAVEAGHGRQWDALFKRSQVVVAAQRAYKQGGAGE